MLDVIDSFLISSQAVDLAGQFQKGYAQERLRFSSEHTAFPWRNQR